LVTVWFPVALAASVTVVVIPIVIPVAPGSPLVAIVRAGIEVIVEGEGFLEGVANLPQNPPFRLIFGFVEIGFAVEIVEFVLEFRLGDVETALIALF
jgi:hypothetical protein